MLRVPRRRVLTGYRKATIMEVNVDCFLRQTWQFECCRDSAGLSVLVQVHPGRRI